MSLAGDVLLSLIQSKFKKRAWTILDDNVKLVLASESSHAGVIGAALFALTFYNDLSDTEKSDRESWDLKSEPCLKPSKSFDVLNFMCSNTSQDRSNEDYTFDNSNEHYTNLNDADMHDVNDSISYNDVTNENYKNGFYDYEDKDNISQKSQEKANALSRQFLVTTSALFLFSAGTTFYMLNNYGNNSARIINSDSGSKTSYIHFAMIAGHSCISSYSLYMLYKGNE
jgi:hypothetical protein